MIREPVDTLSPVLILISLTVPANGAGTSIEALSPSTVISDCSAATLSPTFTITSVTSTSSPPMSGTLTSFTPPAAAGAAAGAGAASAFAGAAAPSAPATSKIMIREPVDTLSPVLILISLTVPANGAGTSIEALSPSTVISDCSAATVSPTFTRISVTSTSSPPMSGTFTSFAAAAAAGAAAGAASFFSSCAGAAAAAPSAESKIMISLPVSVLSPTETLISLTMPA